jgi:hypothetical protein
MRINRAMIFPLAILLLNTATLAQVVTPVPRRDPQALTILQRSLSAMGGVAAVNVRDTVAGVQGTTLGVDGRSTFTATLKTLGLRRFKMESSTADGPFVLVVTDAGAASKSGGREVNSVPTKMVANGGILHIPLLSVLAEWVQADRVLEYVGLETIGSENVHHIRLQRPRPLTDTAAEEAPPFDLFVSTRTMLLVRLIYPMHSPSNIRISEPVTVDYSDYRFVSGLAIPFSVTQTIRGQVIKEFQVTSFAVNQGLAQSEFELR